METFAIKALQLIVALSLLVIIHELGHYLLARILGVKVNRFYLFFNPWFSILKYHPDEGKLDIIAWTTEKRTPDPDAPDDRKKDRVEEVPHQWLKINCGKPHPTTDSKGRPTWAATLYGMGWLPLGGYCALDGMVDETTSADELSSEPQPHEFRAKPAWKRFLIMVAGVTFNFILAIVIYAGIAIHWGDKVVRIDRAYEGMDYAEELKSAGFRTGDMILTVDGRAPEARNTDFAWDMVQPGAQVRVLRGHTDTVTITMPSDMLERVASLKTSPMTLRIPVVVNEPQAGGAAADAGILAGDRIVKVGNDTTPSYTEFYPALTAHAGQETPVTVLRDGKQLTMDVKVSEGGKLGVMLKPVSDIYDIETVTYGLFGGIARGAQMGISQLSNYVSSMKILFTKEGASQVGGFGTIGGLFPDRWNWLMFWEITAFLSVILAFMNIIPIPGLDGGYIMFLLWEIITDRKVPEKYLETANLIGFFFLFLLMIYANANDVIRAFF